MRGYMLKDDYLNAISGAMCQPSHHITLAFMMQVCPTNYLIIYGILSGFYQLLLYSWLSWSTISRWYSIELLISNKPLAFVNLHDGWHSKFYSFNYTLA